MYHQEAIQALPIVETTMNRPGFTMSEVPICEVVSRGYGNEFGVQIRSPETSNDMRDDEFFPLTTAQQVEVIAAVRAKFGYPRGCLVFASSGIASGNPMITLI